MVRRFIAILLLSIPLSSIAQIVGGELFMVKINSPGLNYRLGLTNYFNGNIIYRGTNYSNYYLRIYRKRDNQLMARLEVLKQPDQELLHTNKACADNLGIDYYAIPYFKDYYLDPEIYSDPEGYFIKLDECCRQYEVDNVPDAENTSIVYYAEFPSLKDYPEFSSPEFKPPSFQVFCVNQSFSSNFGAPEIPSLTQKYELTDPLEGYTTFLSPTNPRSTSLVYNGIEWAGSYSKNQIFRGSPTLSINSQTGVIGGHPVETGNFIFALNCEILKGNETIGNFRRDFVISVVECEDNPVISQISSSSGQIVSDTLAICPGQKIELESDFSENHNYTWERNGELISNEQTVEINSSGLYKLTKTAKNSCSNRSQADSVFVKLSNEPAELKIVTNGSPCEGDTITLASENPTNSQYSWFLNGSLIGNSNSIKVSKSGFYKLLMEDPACSNTLAADSLNLTFHPKPTNLSPMPAYGFCQGDNLNLTASKNSSWEYQWLKNGEEIVGENSPEFQVNELGNYQVRIVSQGCELISEEYQVTSGASCGGSSVLGVYIPNTFTPNKDQINDAFHIFGANNLTPTHFSFTLFNRWGNLIYQTDDINFQWDGSYRGKTIEVGVYLFKMELDGITQKGTLQILK